MKSEAGDYSVDQLAKDGRTAWTGVRNYKARNTMRDEMKVGHLVLYYHSNAEPPGVVGLARVASGPYPDPTQFEKQSRYFDPKATRDEPRWWLVDIELVEKFRRLVSLAEIRAHPDLQEMALLRQSRLSVQPVREGELQIIRKLGKS